MAIEINSRSQNYKTIFSLTNILAVVCLVLAVILLGIYLFFAFNTSRMNKLITEKEMASSALTQNIMKKEMEINPLKEKIENFGGLIEQHKIPINIFTVIENNCFPNVQFTDLTFDSAEMAVTLLAHTDDLATVEQQFASIKEEPLLAEVTLSGVSFSGGGDEGEEGGEEDSEGIEEREEGVEFTLKLIFKPEVLNK